MESRNEETISRISKLTDMLSSLQEALAIKDMDVRNKRTLKSVTSMIEEIETSYEWLVGIPREQAHKLVEMLTPLLTYSKIYESTTSILQCIERSRKILAEITRKDETAYRIDVLFRQLADSVNSLADQNLKRVNSYLKTANLDLLTSSLSNELVGQLLERYYLPELVKCMGYELKSRVVATSVGDVQIDVRAEKDEIGGFEKLEKLQKRHVIIVETKATVEAKDIKMLSEKRKAILENYRKDSEIWSYNLRSETWMVACYGWNDELKTYAQRQDIKPIDGEELHRMLEEHNRFNRSRPACPKQLNY